MRFSKEENKKLIERYPFLQPRNVWTDEIREDYNYSYIRGVGEIPDGWVRLFLQMCEDIREPLIKHNYLDKFRFTQIKEKYNSMRLYNNGVPDEVWDILSKYEHMSRYICTVCGKPAMYETNGYIESFCEDCWKDKARHRSGEFIHLKTSYKISGHKNGEDYERIVSCEDEWNRYVKSLNYPENDPFNKCKMNSEEFVDQYCKMCGTQRCEGIESEWFEGCRYKEYLKKN